MSTPSSLARRRASGEAKIRPSLASLRGAAAGCERRRRHLRLGLRGLGFGRLGLGRPGGRGLRRRCGDGARVLAVGQNHGDRGIDRDIVGAFRDHDLAEPPLVDGFDLHGGLVGLDLGDDIAGAHRVTLVLQPFGELALLHGRRQRGHQNRRRHVLSSCLSSARSAIEHGFGGGNDVLDGRQGELLEIGRIGHRHVLAGDAGHRRIELVEGVGHELGRDLRADRE